MGSKTLKMADLMEIILYFSVYSIDRFLGAGDQKLVVNIKSSAVTSPSLSHFSTTF